MQQKIKICKKCNKKTINKDFPKDFQPDPESDIVQETFIDTDSIIYKKLSKKGNLGKFLACLILFFKID